ncbi:MAG: integration host factor subunit beta, partial [Proteobacteria bacterium]|nr:integration host factor subunit beta [Pseudomonadota bacterium]
KTGAKILTQPKYSAHFKPGKELRERINQARLTNPIIDTEETAEEE